MLIFLIWLVAPFVELGIIIVLFIVSRNRKRRIEELTRQLPNPCPAERGTSSRNLPGSESAGRSGTPGQSGTDTHILEEDTHILEEKTVCPLPKTQFQNRQPHNSLSLHPSGRVQFRPSGKIRVPDLKSGLFQGTAALIIGVIFVVLSGLIFATTAWHILPNVCKAAVALAFAALFFGASALAGKKFKIRRTGIAFYILGSIFLFLSVLAVGYFGLLGPEFLLRGENRFRVLWVGSIVTECALFWGYRRFADRIYTQACLWGLTVSMMFLMGSFHLEYPEFIDGMMCCAGVLVAVRWYFRGHVGKGQGGEAAESWRLTRVFPSFAVNHFLFFSALMTLNVWLGFKQFFLANLFLEPFRVTVWSALAAGFMTVGLTFLGVEKDNGFMRAVHGIACVVFFHYSALCLPVDFTYQLLAAAVLTGGYFLAEGKVKNPLQSIYGDTAATVLLTGDTLVLAIIAAFTGNGMGEQAAASAAVLLLTAALGRWSRRHPILRGGLPIVLSFLTVTFYNGCETAFGVGLRMDLVLGIYLFAIAVWDLMRRDRFCPSILVLGTASQLIFRCIGRSPLPTFLMLAVYLLLRRREEDGVASQRYLKGSFLYLMAGTCVMVDYFTGNGVLTMLSVLMVYAAEYGFMLFRDRENGRNVFWDASGVVLFLMTMREFYFDSDLIYRNLVPCMTVFAILYFLFYRNGRPWPHLAITLSVLSVPSALAAQDWLTVNQLYSGVGAAVLFTGLFARRFRPLWEETQDASGVRRIDWYHILIVLPLILMMFQAGDRWRCVYVILLAFYAVQYAQISSLEKISLTAAGALLLTAFWLQPFIAWPQVIRLEMGLLPAAVFTGVLPVIWGRSRGLRYFQNTCYILSLALLILDAFFSGNVVDALILEVICLTAFIWSHINRSVLWLRISATVIVTVALYMTKDFWVSVSWWVYLLAAGLGLIGFAAVKEMKKR